MNEEGKYSLDAVQNNPGVEGSLRQVLNNTQENVSKLSKMIQASGYLGNGNDWNNYTETGVYKVGTVMEAINHAPLGMYQWGTLIVLRSEIGGEDPTLQVYIPLDNVSLAIRTYVESAWRPWYKITGTLLQ